MGLPSREEEPNTTSYCLSPRIYQAPPSSMEGMEECPRKKKMFSSSSFYEEPNCIYPTVEEQVKLCRQIAESLSDDCNQKSKGANMFFKRVKKAEKWIVAQSNVREEDEEGGAGSGAPLSQLPYVRPKKSHHLKLILDPRQIIDMRKLLEEGVDIVEHNAVSPEVCHNLVRDLNAPTGKGAQLFARRKKKSEEWVVDDDKVRHLLRERYPAMEVEPLVHPRVKALSEVDSKAVVESVIRAAEAKVMTYPNAVPQVPVIRSLDDPFKYSAPKGWAPTMSSSPMSQQLNPAPAKVDNSSPLSRTLSFTNFNGSPKAWGAAILPTASVRPVRPPSVLMRVQ